MKITNKVKGFVLQQIAIQMFKVKATAEKLKTKLLVKYIVPELTEYLRQLIIAKGLDPNKPRTIAAVQPELPFDKPNVRPRVLAYHYVPSWVKDSFKNPKNHPIAKSREKELPEVVEVADNTTNRFKTALAEIENEALKALEKQLNDELTTFVEPLQVVEKPIKKAPKKKAKKTVAKASKFNIKEAFPHKEPTVKVVKKFGSFSRVKVED